jgi:hypothetical protein
MALISLLLSLLSNQAASSKNNNHANDIKPALGSFYNKQKCLSLSDTFEMAKLTKNEYASFHFHL